MNEDRIKELEATLSNESLSEDERKKCANEIISLKINEAEKLIGQCEELADKNSLEFSWNLAYGMGGWYSSGEWMSSSADC